jgi:hypothetical protein
MLKDTNKNTKETANNQKERLFSLGKAISWAPTSKGSAQLPKPAIRIGITT